MVSPDPMTLLTGPTKLRKHVPRVNAESTTRPLDLPTGELDGAGTLAKASHFFDMITDHAGQVNRESIIDACQTGAYDSLPEELTLKEKPPCPYVMQLFFVPKENGNHFVFKHVRLDEKCPIGLVQTLCRGIGYRVVWGGHEKAGMKRLVHLLNNLPGFQARLWTFDHSDKEQVADMMDEEQIDAGFDFLEENVPEVPKKKLLRQVTKSQSDLLSRGLLPSRFPTGGRWDIY